MAKNGAASGAQQPHVDYSTTSAPSKSSSPDNGATETTRLLAGSGPHGDGQENGGDPGQSSEAWDGLDDFKGLPWYRRPSVFWLLAPYGLFTLAFGGIMVPKLNLIIALVCKKYFADQTVIDPDNHVIPVILGGENPQCRIPEVQSNVASFTLVMTFITGLLSCIVVPKLGHLSDRYGRLRLLAVASVGGLIAELITILAVKFPETIDYRWMILGSVFDGLTGSFTAGSVMTQSYTSDCTPPSKRAVRLGYLHACLYLGLAFGPLLAAYFVKWTGSLISIFYVTLGCHICFVLFVGLVVPESLSKRKQRAARDMWAKEKASQAQMMGSWLANLQAANPFEPLRQLWPTGPGTSLRLRVNILVLALGDMIILGSSIAVGAVVILYSEYQFEWGNLESSRFISALSQVRVVALMIVLPMIVYFGRTRPQKRLQRDLRAPLVERNVGPDRLDIWIIRLALISDVVGVIGYVLARDERLFFLSGMVTAFGGLGGATIQAAVTKSVPSDLIGRVIGAIGVLHALSRVVGPVLFNGIYAATVKTYPQAFFVVLGSIFAATLLASFLIKPGVHWETYTEEETEPLHPSRPVPEAIPTTPVSLDGEEPIFR